jgi:beta-glucosidase
MSKNDNLSISVDIANTGDMDGDEVVLIYINDKVSTVTTPVRKLVAFKRIHLKRGEKQTLNFTIANKDFALLDRYMESVVEPGEFEIIIGDRLSVETVNAQP